MKTTQTFTHSYMCVECKNLNTRITSKISLEVGVFDCGYCQKPIWEGCHVSSKENFPFVMDTDLIACSAIMSGFISNIPRDEVFCMSDLINSSIDTVDKLKKQLKDNKK